MEVPDAAKDTLLTPVEHYLNLLDSLLNEVEKVKYDIANESRDNMAADICQMYGRESWRLEVRHGSTVLASAEIRPAPLVAAVKERVEHATKNCYRALAAGAASDLGGRSASRKPTPTQPTQSDKDLIDRLMDDEVAGAPEVAGPDDDTGGGLGDQNQLVPSSTESEEKQEQLTEEEIREHQPQQARELLGGPSKIV